MLNKKCVSSALLRKLPSSFRQKIPIGKFINVLLYSIGRITEELEWINYTMRLKSFVTKKCYNITKKSNCYVYISIEIVHWLHISSLSWLYIKFFRLYLVIQSFTILYSFIQFYIQIFIYIFLWWSKQKFVISLIYILISNLKYFGHIPKFAFYLNGSYVNPILAK